MDAGNEPFVLPEVDHIGIIVSNMERAVKYYEALGFGPFKPLQRGSPNIERLVYGRPANDVKNSILMGQMGGVMVELLQPLSGNSTQQEFLDKHGEGVNHIGFHVADRDKVTGQLTARGFKAVSATRRANGGGSTYFDTDKVGGLQLEFTQL